MQRFQGRQALPSLQSAQHPFGRKFSWRSLQHLQPKELLAQSIDLDTLQQQEHAHALCDTAAVA